MALMHRLSIARKIFLVASSFALPIAVLVYFVVANINADVRFTSLEREGNRYQVPLEALLRHLREHQGLAHGCPAASDCAAVLARTSTQLDVDFVNLGSVDGAIGRALQFTDGGLAKRSREHLRVANVEQEWRELATAVAEGVSPVDLDRRYDHLIDDVRAMITHAGDTSNLILDPDLDTYYTMDVTLLALPQAQDRLARVAAFARTFLDGGAMTAADRVQLAVHAALLEEADLERVVGSLETALSEDASFYGERASFQSAIPPALEAYRNAAGVFITLTRQLADESAEAVGRDVYLAAASAAREASFALWDVASRQLDGMLDVRLDALAASRAWALGFSALALLAAATMALAAMRSITQPLDGQVRALGPGADLLAGCVERIAEVNQQQANTTPESTVICEELMAHAEDMRKSVRALVDLVHGQSADVAGVVAVQRAMA